MCTVTWLHQPGGYQVFFNRDEKKARQIASPPVEQHLNGINVLAPIDGNAGGSWLAANEKGLTLGLLNHYSAERTSDSQKISRGRLLISLMDAGSGDEVAQRLRSLPLENYKPFYLVSFEPDRAPQRSLWDGVALELRSLDDRDLPLTTSSFDSANVIAGRRHIFTQMCVPPLTSDQLVKFHSHAEPRGAYGVFMNRPDAETVSFSRVGVAPGRVEFLYAPRVPGSLDFPAGTVYSLTR